MFQSHTVSEARPHADATRLAALFDRMAQGVVYVDRQGAVVLANRSAERILGLTLDQMQGRASVDPRWRLFREDGSDFPPDEYPSTVALRTGKEVNDVLMGVFNAAENRQRWIAVNAVPRFRDGEAEPHEVFTTFDDITHLKEVEFALRDAQHGVRETLNLFEAVVEGSSDPVFVKNLQGQYLLMNSAGAKIVGRPSSEIVGKTIFELATPDLAQRLTQYEEEVLRDGKAVTYEADGPGLGGTWRFLVTKAPYRNAKGEIVGVIGVARDLSAVQRLQDELRQVQKMDAVGRLAGGIAHDFNNLLTVIVGYLEELESEVSGGGRDSLREVKGAAERATQLTSQLLAFSRRQVLQPRPSDLNELVRNLQRMLRRILGEDIALTSVLAPDLGTVLIDRGQFDQVLLNLVVNARDAMPDGGILTIETRNLEVTEPSRSPYSGVTPGRYATLSVTDNGVGMDRETCTRVFEPFFTTKGRTGTGLGLATVYGILKQSGGDIHVTSEPSRGACFTIILPHTDQALVAAAGRTARAAEGGTETILVVEDERSARTLLTTVLRRRGYSVFACPDPEAAIEWSASYDGPLHLLVTDVVMPNGNGPELARALRRVRGNVKVLLMSGYADHPALNEADRSIAEHFLQKPFTPSTLANKVREVLES